ncbi:MAG: nucleoside deaminase [Magnetococcus sp. WYHC-3]
MRDGHHPVDMTVRQHLDLALRLAREKMLAGEGGPFGAVIADSASGALVTTGWNQVLVSGDPTAHAEVVAIRRAAALRGGYNLAGWTLYSSCEPCPMCLGAVYWAGLDAVWFAASRLDAAQAGFSDDFIYRELERDPSQRQIPFRACTHEGADEPFRLWCAKNDRKAY